MSIRTRTSGIMVPAFVMPAASGGYTAQGITFNGSSYLTRGSSIGADGKKGIISVWFKMQGSDATNGMIIETLDPFFQIIRLNTNKIRITGQNAATTNILQLFSNTSFTVGMGWAHLLASWDLNTPAGWLYITDADDLASSPTLTNDTINYSTNPVVNWGVGARADGTILITADIADLYMNIAESLDLSVEANRRKFISATNAPVDLGADGSTPTGTAPAIFFHGTLASWQTNDGSGGGFSVTAGSLSAASSNPP